MGFRFNNRIQGLRKRRSDDSGSSSSSNRFKYHIKTYPDKQVISPKENVAQQRSFTLDKQDRQFLESLGLSLRYR